MSQSLSNVLIHLVFSTKTRTPNLMPPVQAKLYPSMVATLRNHGCPVIQIGGVADHIHVLYVQSLTLTIAQAVEKVKSSSSKMLKDDIRDFAWQGGYGAFSVAPGDRGAVARYILNQEEHHRKETFQEEYRRILNEMGVPFEERYVWD